MTITRDFSFDHDFDDYEEEKAYMQVISSSVSHMGKWCLSVTSGVRDGAEADPFAADPNSRQFLEQVQQFLIEKAMSILDTDCLEIGWPMVDFLTDWI